MDAISPTPLLRTVLGDVLRRERAAQGRTLSDVAAAASISVPYLSEIERGRKEASSEVLSAVCGALRVGLSAVLADAGQDVAAHERTRARVVRLRAIREQRIVGTRAPVTSIAPRAGASGPLCLAA